MSIFDELTLAEAAKIYSDSGFAVIPLKPKTKAAYIDGWNNPGFTINPETHWKNHPDDNIGILLEPSGLVSLDIDNLEEFLIAVKSIGLTPNDGEKPFWESDTAGIKSGKANKAKLIFKAPKQEKLEGQKLTYHSLKWNSIDAKKHTVFELRCGYKQDVFPPSIHPDTGKPYVWVGGSVKELPADLLLLWLNWNTFERALIKCDRFYKDEPRTPKRGRPVKAFTGRDIISEWNDKQNLRQRLEQYGYKRVGSRYVRPGSHSGEPSVIISGDNRTFYTFSDSDVFADGHQHNAFDLLLYYEFKGDIRPAIEAIKRDLGLLEIKDKDLLCTVKNLLANGDNHD